jgi:hypothetical protein
MKSNCELTMKEKRVIDRLAEAWNSFTELEIEHVDDMRDFRKAIHDAQRIIMCRPVRKTLT